MNALLRLLTVMLPCFLAAGAGGDGRAYAGALAVQGAAVQDVPGPVYDVLCDAAVNVHSCHPAHPYGRILDFGALERRLNGFPAATMTATLVSGRTLSSRRFKVIEQVIIIGRDTLSPREINRLALRSTWPQWSTVADLAAGGALMFGGVGLIIDGLQWVGGSGGDLGATGTGALVGAGLFGGLGILFAREHYHVLIQEGWELRVVKGAPAHHPPDGEIPLAGARPRAQ